MPYRADIAGIVVGTLLDEATLDSVVDSLATLEPPDDVEVSGTYRLRVGCTLARRALTEAVDHARQEAAL